MDGAGRPDEAGGTVLHPGRYRHQTGAGQILAEGGCTVALAGEHLVIQPESGGEHRLYYSDIEQVADSEWTIWLVMQGGDLFALFFLGAWYGQCVRELKDRRNSQLVRNLLMLDAGFEKEFRGAYVLSGPAGEELHADVGATIALYRSSLVVQPDHADFFNVAYADIAAMNFDPSEYALKLRLEPGGQLTLRMLGRRFGELEQEIQRLTDAMYQRTESALAAEFQGQVPAGSLRAATGLLRQGKPVSREVLEQAAAGFWPAFEAKLLAGGAEGEPDTVRQACMARLQTMAGPGNLYVGFRESFFSSESQPQPVYWLVALFPDRGRAAVEVTGETAHATYVYRLEGDPERYVQDLSRALVAINFRRDVISLPDSDLAGERLARYRVALRKLAHVQRLRELFVGKAAHTSEQAWQRRMDDLLQA